MRLTFLALAVALVLTACPKDEPAGTTAAPGASKPGGAPSPGTGAPPTAPASQPTEGAPRAAVPDTASPFAGEVRLAEGVKPDVVKPTDTLFIMVRELTPEGKPGRLLAAQRHQPVQLPLKYELGAKDTMVPGTAFVGPFVVQARLDRDGDPMTKGDDDLYAEFGSPVKGGQQGVDLTLKPGKPAP
jgi:hypothetical protein